MAGSILRSRLLIGCPAPSRSRSTGQIHLEDGAATLAPQTPGIAAVRTRDLPDESEAAPASEPGLGGARRSERCGDLPYGSTRVFGAASEATARYSGYRRFSVTVQQENVTPQPKP